MGNASADILFRFFSGGVGTLFTFSDPGPLCTCTASYDTATNTASAAFMNSSRRTTTLTITVRPSASGGGNEVALALDAEDETLSALPPATGYQGTYATNPAYLAVASSCVVFSTLDMRHGGGMSGSLMSCSLQNTGGLNSSAIFATGSFSVTFP
jgi:hypothetical protein